MASKDAKQAVVRMKHKRDALAKTLSWMEMPAKSMLYGNFWVWLFALTSDFVWQEVILGQAVWRSEVVRILAVHYMIVVCAMAYLMEVVCILE